MATTTHSARPTPTPQAQVFTPTIHQVVQLVMREFRQRRIRHRRKSW